MCTCTIRIGISQHPMDCSPTDWIRVEGKKYCGAACQPGQMQNPGVSLEVIAKQLRKGFSHEKLSIVSLFWTGREGGLGVS